MDQLNKLSKTSEELFNQFKQAKENRIKIETHSKLLQNKISNLKLKEQLSLKKIEKVKTLSKKLSRQKQQRLSHLKSLESQHRKYQEELETKSKTNRDQSLKSRQKIKENWGKILTERRNDCKIIRNKQETNKLKLEYEYKKKQEDNNVLKNLMMTDKDFWKKENEKFKEFKRLEIRKEYYTRRQIESDLMFCKMKEKEMMEDVDMAILEYLHDGKIATK